MNRNIFALFVFIIWGAACSERALNIPERFDFTDVTIITDTGITQDVFSGDVSDIVETPLRLIFEADRPKPLFGEVALLPSLSEERTLVIDMVLGGDDNQRLFLYGLYYRISFPEDTLEVETVRAAHPELPAGLINKFSIRRGEIIGVITNKGEAPMFSLGCKRPIISIRFKIKMIRAGRIDIVSSKTQIVDDRLMPVINNYFGGRLSIIQK